MKSFVSWMTDPCVHLFLIVVVLFYASMSSSESFDAAKEHGIICKRCEGLHDGENGCASLVKKPYVMQAEASPPETSPPNDSAE